MYESEQGKKALRHAVELHGEQEMISNLVKLGYPREVAEDKVKAALEIESDWLMIGGL
jgi:Holliday junction resolvasome RuvABC DNA-binding subunit